MSSETPREKIFLSYGHDRYAGEILAIKSDLEARGHHVWYDLDRLAAGVDWERYIEDGLQWCDKVVLAMTPHSVRRRGAQEPASTDGFCLNELAKALQLHKPIIPIQLARLDQGPPTSICRLQFIDMTDCVPIAERRDRYEPRLALLLQALERGLADTEGNQARLLRYLQPLNFDSEMSSHIARFRGRRWLRDALNAWLDEPSDSRVFWIIAGPGIGKTAFAAQLCHSRDDVIACHFCRHGHADKTDARRAVLSLAYQMAMHLPQYARRLQELAIEDEYQKNAQTLFETLIIEPLNGLDPPPGPRLIVIDALDEAAGADQRNDIALIVARNWERTPSWLELVVTSRPETEVVAQLQILQKLRPFVIHAEGEENLQDARMFVQSELGDRAKNASAVETLLERSEGNFLYLRVVLDEIGAGRVQLEHLQTFPRGMGGYYQQFFERRVPDFVDYKTRFRPVLAPIIAQRAPLPLTMLASATQLGAFAVDDALQVLGSLFPLQREDGVLAVTILHKSLRDWLTSRNEVTGKLTAGAYALDIEAGEERLAEACWGEYTAGSAAMSAYATRHLLDHLAAARRFTDLERGLRDKTSLLARNALVASALAPPRPWTAFDPLEIEIRKLHEELRASPGLFELLFRLGTLYGRREQWENAIRYLTEAAEAAPPGNPQALVNLSLAYATVRDYGRALSAGQAAARIQFQPNIFLAIGLALEGLDRQDEAITVYIEGLRRWPSNSDLALTLGNTFGRKRDYANAIECYERALRADPSNLFAISNIAYAYEEQGHVQRAFEYLQRATEADPDDAVAWFDLGHAYKKAGAPDKALDCFLQSFHLDTKFYKACLSIALEFEDAGRLEESVEYYARAMSLTDSKDLREAIGRQIVGALQITSELAPCFEPAVALEYSRLWLQVNRARKKGPRSPDHSGPDSFSHYRIVEKTGEGPSGTVFRAVDVWLNRAVAVKILRSEGAGALRLESFLKTATAISTLSHAHLCPIYEVGEAGGAAFVAMEFLSANSLRSEVDMKSRPYPDMLRLATELAQAMAEAHDDGVVHGDLKPENVLFSADGTAKIVDFGAAQLARWSNPLYVAPECLAGAAADGRSDVYSLGVVFYEMARDLVPLERRSPMPPLSAEMLSEVPAEFAGILLKAIENDPGGRYPSAKELANDLSNLIDCISAGTK